MDTGMINDEEIIEFSKQTTIVMWWMHANEAEAGYKMSVRLYKSRYQVEENNWKTKNIQIMVSPLCEN